MVKTRPKPSKPTPSDNRPRRRLRKSRRRSIAQSASSNSKIFIDQMQVFSHEVELHHKIPKQSHSPDDIDMYFDLDPNPHHKNKEQFHQIKQRLQKEKIIPEEVQEQINEDIEEQKMNQIESNEVIKYQRHVDQLQPPSPSPLLHVNQTSEIEKPQESYENQLPNSPIAGGKIMKSFKTPTNNKLEELKAFDQSEQIVNMPLFEQLQLASKNSPPSHQISNIVLIGQHTPQRQLEKQVFKTAKKIRKDKKFTSQDSSKKKVKIQQDYQKPNSIQFSFRRQNPEEQMRRRSRVMKLQTLTQMHSLYDKTQKILQSFENSIKTLVNYYKLREGNYKILSFRENVSKILEEEIRKIMDNIKEKRDVCFGSIYEQFNRKGENFEAEKEKMKYCGL